MNLPDELDKLFDQCKMPLVRKASEALVLEELLSDKLYRALVLSLKTNLTGKEKDIIDEALVFYETSRLIGVLPE